MQFSTRCINNAIFYSLYKLKDMTELNDVGQFKDVNRDSEDMID